MRFFPPVAWPKMSKSALGNSAITFVFLQKQSQTSYSSYRTNLDFEDCFEVEKYPSHTRKDKGFTDKITF